MAKYLLLKHYRGAPAPVNDVPMDQWTPEEISAHMQYMSDFATRLEETGEFVDGQALAPEGTFVRYDGEGRPPVTDGPFAETKELVSGYWVWEVRDMDEAVEWVKRCPNPMFGPSEIEIRPVVDASDFGEALEPALAAEMEKIRKNEQL